MAAANVAIEFILVICLLGLTDGRTLVANKDDTERAKSISSDLSTLKLSKIPHRIYLAGNDIIDGFEETSLNKNHVEMKFTYELVQPTMCELFNPPFGCCWDNKTVALGPHNEGCPICKDQKKSCRKWRDQCGSKTVQDICPQTCNICPKPKDLSDSCQDSPDQKGFCPYYARFGLCKRAQIRKYCRKSCNACSIQSTIKQIWESTA